MPFVKYMSIRSYAASYYRTAHIFLNGMYLICIIYLDEDDKKEDKEVNSRDSPIRVSVSSVGPHGHGQWRRESVTIIEGHEPGESEIEFNKEDTITNPEPASR